MFSSDLESRSREKNNECPGRFPLWFIREHTITDYNKEMPSHNDAKTFEEEINT